MHSPCRDGIVTLDERKNPHSADLSLPAYQTAGASGFDLPAAISETLVIMPCVCVLVPTGFAIEIPPGYEGQLRGRSGLGRMGLAVAQGVGTIDSDFRGEIGALLINNSRAPIKINRGDRIAQLVIAPVTQAHIVEVDQLSSTARGEAGYGSTGT